MQKSALWWSTLAACSAALCACRAPASTHATEATAPEVGNAADDRRAPSLAKDVARARPPALLEVAEAPTGTRLDAAHGDLLPATRPFTDLAADYALEGAMRSRHARSSKLDTVVALFDAAGVKFPPAELLFRGYKAERELEVWASSRPGAPMVHVTSYEICAASGDLGPKRREGDRQVPEGFYTIHYLWPDSAFYLSMKVGYPNTSDKILGGPMPGSDIMVHGGCASIGCLAMSDERIQELWVMAEPVQTKAGVRIHVFPAKNRNILAEHPRFEQHRVFWETIYQGHDLFEAQRRPPEVTVHWDGSYRFKS